MAQSTEVAIIGGGVIGCSIAYELSKRDIECTLFERSKLASGASGVTAGIIGPLWYLNPKDVPTFRLGRQSLAMFPPLVATLINTGTTPSFFNHGILRIAITHTELMALKERFTWLNKFNCQLEWLNNTELLNLEPGLNPNVIAGVYSPTEGSVHGKNYIGALSHAAKTFGAKFLEDTEVLGLETIAHTVIGVRTKNNTCHAGHTVLAAGPWTGINQKWAHDRFPIRPVKGQRIALKKKGFKPSLTISRTGGSIIPQNNDTILVSGTREEGLFNFDVTENGVKKMWTSAIEAFPDLKDAKFMGALAGVRPGSPDDTPIMGPVPGLNRLIIASGHDHSGIMLSPGSSKLIADYIETGDSSELSPFNIQRFDNEPPIHKTRCSDTD
ncbi:MAG: FAD-dependent oxidoreductase [SAR202 cluster bacterium]|nr:FAD-dependent oxidoreductase [SAR202 cluster bacterium]